MFFAKAAGDLQLHQPDSHLIDYVTLFLNGFRWPSNSNATFNGTDLKDFMDRPVDLDGDGQEGGSGVWTFSTLAVGLHPSTIVAVEYLTPTPAGRNSLEGVIISVVGNEEQWTVLTDSNGEFSLRQLPLDAFSWLSTDDLLEAKLERHWPAITGRKETITPLSAKLGRLCQVKR